LRRRRRYAAARFMSRDPSLALRAIVGAGRRRVVSAMAAQARVSVGAQAQEAFQIGGGEGRERRGIPKRARRTA